MLLGRITYELMASFWSTPQAMAMAPIVPQRMNAMPKLVASRTMTSATWNNTTVVSDLIASVQKLKSAPGDDIAILGSGSIVSQLMKAQLIDEVQTVVSRIVVGRGRLLFETVDTMRRLRRTRTRAFANGCVSASYELAAQS